MEENAVSAELKNMHRMVLSVKQSKEVGARYMWMIEHEMELREEGKTINIISQICKKIVKNKSMEQIVEEMEAMPYYEYVLEVADTNIAAVKLYEKLGFSEFQRVKEPNSKRSGLNFYVYMKREYP